MANILKVYKNGNATIAIFDDGTRIINSKDDRLDLEYPLSVDMKITNSCNMGCPYCHEDSKPNGPHADLKNLPYLTTFLPYTEVAIGGGNILEHPDIDWLLETYKEKHILANVTINQKHFVESYDRIKNWVDNDLVKGVGISLTDNKDPKFLELVKTIPNAVIHVINGIFSYEDYQYIKDHNLNMLILGYKTFRRGKSFLDIKANDDLLRERWEWLNFNLEGVSKHFKAVAFDNLGLEQLPVKELAGDNWDHLYQGDDGSSSFYIDAVNKQYSRNSTAAIEGERYPIMENVKDMFADIRRKTGN